MISNGKAMIKNLLPTYFALVMATGIVSIALHLLEFESFSRGLFWLNVGFFSVLFILLLTRIIFYFPSVLSDLKSYQKGPGFFTFVAAAAILANQIALFYDVNQWVLALFITALFAWILITYGFFYFITVTENKQGLEQGISGTWLIIIVATQALSTLFTLVADLSYFNPEIFLFISLCLFFTGALLYLYIMSLIVYRLSFFELKADELGAPYWINMGATAITTLAGSLLILKSNEMPLLKEILPFTKAFTLFYWAGGTWWIPLLLILGAWRHLKMRVPVPSSSSGYHPSYWGMVFPLGMYTVCTYRLSQALGLDFLQIIPQYFIYLAVSAWLAVFVGFLRNIFQGLVTSK
ncbi:tellurite resistance/C4-dicarboxylate transporter family protein [Cyclobacterium plantarum]|uniref:C4-dicarboxylate ABC transporter n=1 Tax=Cyclobacterium plantarum TaxID=2716263 RepID=A0ABX0H8F5_9BACT|nr:tellurite resistance/C4-dicarboxylate transporter family protein [Cyclobacterium plantarum]NHE56506.1 C4-dicarboxylate ABC transporter [Cyclobacterium plantarum]